MNKPGILKNVDIDDIDKVICILECILKPETKTNVDIGVNIAKRHISEIKKYKRFIKLNKLLKNR